MSPASLVVRWPSAPEAVRPRGSICRVWWPSAPEAEILEPVKTWFIEHVTDLASSADGNMSVTDEGERASSTLFRLLSGVCPCQLPYLFQCVTAAVDVDVSLFQMGRARSTAGHRRTSKSPSRWRKPTDVIGLRPSPVPVPRPGPPDAQDEPARPPGIGHGESRAWGEPSGGGSRRSSTPAPRDRADRAAAAAEARRMGSSGSSAVVPWMSGSSAAAATPAPAAAWPQAAPPWREQRSSAPGTPRSSSRPPWRSSASAPGTPRGAQTPRDSLADDAASSAARGLPTAVELFESLGLDNQAFEAALPIPKARLV